jgi:hypothetical protein
MVTPFFARHWMYAVNAVLPAPFPAFWLPEVPVVEELFDPPPHAAASITAAPATIRAPARRGDFALTIRTIPHFLRHRCRAHPSPRTCTQRRMLLGVASEPPYGALLLRGNSEVEWSGRRSRTATLPGHG